MAGVGTDALPGHFCPQCGQFTGVFSAGDCGAFCGTFWSGWRLSSRKRRCPKDFGGALWPFRKEIEVITSPKTGSARQVCFESPQSMKRDFQAFKNRTAVTKEERSPAAQKLRRHRQR